MRNDSMLAKRVMDIASCSSLSRKCWDDLCSRVIEPLLNIIAAEKDTVVIGGKKYRLEELSESLVNGIDGDNAKDYILRTYEYSSLVKKFEAQLQSPPLVDNAEVAKRISEGGTIEEEINNRLVPAGAFVEIAEEFEDKVDCKQIILELLNVALEINAEFMKIVTDSTVPLARRAKAANDRLSGLAEEEPSTNMMNSQEDESTENTSEEATPSESVEEPVAAEETTDITSNDQGLKETMNNEDEGFKFVGDTSSIKPEDTASANPSPEYPRKEDMGGDGAGGADESGDGGDETSDDDDAKSDEDADSSFD